WHARCPVGLAWERRTERTEPRAYVRLDGAHGDPDSAGVHFHPRYATAGAEEGPVQRVGEPARPAAAVADREPLRAGARVPIPGRPSLPGCAAARCRRCPAAGSGP